MRDQVILLAYLYFRGALKFSVVLALQLLMSAVGLLNAAQELL